MLSHTVYPLSKKHLIYNMSVGQGREEKKEKKQFKKNKQKSQGEQVTVKEILMIRCNCKL